MNAMARFKSRRRSGIVGAEPEEQQCENKKKKKKKNKEGAYHQSIIEPVALRSPVGRPTPSDILHETKGRKEGKEKRKRRLTGEVGFSKKFSLLLIFSDDTLEVVDLGEVEVARVSGHFENFGGSSLFAKSAARKDAAR
jgi:hypothetical protein